MGTGDSVRVFESEELEGFDEEGHDDGAHEEGGGTAEETGDGHDLDRCVGEEVCRPCTHVEERREEIISTGNLKLDASIHMHCFVHEGFVRVRFVLTRFVEATYCPVA